MYEKIAQLDEEEVDWDAEDDYNSPYILGEKLKKK